MSLNSTPASERIRIGFFGICNAGKSSVVNAVTGQDLSIVSDTAGTTTDPVRKTMEILPLGPVVIVDTPGIDDSGDLGSLRVRKAKEALEGCDIAVLVIDAIRGMQAADRDLIKSIQAKNIPLVIAWNKTDLLSATDKNTFSITESELLVSAVTGEGIHELKEMIARSMKTLHNEKRLVADLVNEGEICILVIPIDSSAPKGRIILPQQMVLRDLLDTHATALVCQPEELGGLINALPVAPRLVITDSQAFAAVANVVPESVPLTSFSILMARYRGDLAAFAHGAQAMENLKDGDRVLIAEACTHHRQCEDIGTVKIPRLIRQLSGSEPQFEFTSGGHFPDNLEGIALVVHCGGCMINDKEMAARLAKAQEQHIPVINYGMALAHITGVLRRSLEPLPEAKVLLNA